MRRVNPGGVRQRHQFVVQRVVELVGKFLASEADRGQQVGPADIADEQSVAGQHAMGNGVVGMLVTTTMLRDSGVCPGCGGIPASPPQRVAFAVRDAGGLELGFGDRRVHDLRAGGIGQPRGGRR